MRKVLFVLGMMIGIIAKGQWSEISGLNSLGTIYSVKCMCSDSNGNLYVAGEFVNANGKNFVAKYDGISWSELGGFNGLNVTTISTVNAIYCDKFNNIYVAGTFWNASLNYYVAKFDGSNWSELGGINTIQAGNQLTSLVADSSGYIYVSDYSGFVYKFNGASWSSNNGGGNSVIRNLCITPNNDLYGSALNLNYQGNFSPMKYNGTNWVALANTNPQLLNQGSTGIFSDKFNNLYVFGFYHNWTNRCLLKWDGVSWTEVGGVNSLSANSTISGFCTDSVNNIYLGGAFVNSIGKNYIAKFNGVTWSDFGTLNANGIIRSLHIAKNGNMYAAGDFTNSNGKVIVVKYVQPLPLKLLSFTAKQRTPNSVALNWQTANEVNVSHFNIQRGNNGKDFTNIGKVNASCCEYSYIDNSLRPTVDSKLYYRLEMVDKDGSKTYSSTQLITINSKLSTLSIYPNPAKDQVNIECSGLKNC